ncbi:hypothetical protein [Chryseobacterium balustinum]|uniref:Uncharacterized protein n=1 Tax=Chryseobacterium balustinum TaxID=246 RepID=A0ABY1LBF0_9FLAO|nr:hypothetical protein [Chryseobacterium balustinum]AZB32123.1 hypothetical protein EB354_22855 [Chryseobacterium balustinum]SKB93964.1 hypothetical protein SAMN05421800_11558 [Chryseobacterium balustinum]
MKYYYLIDSLSDEQQTGIYGRRMPTEQEKKDLTVKDFLSIFDFSDNNDSKKSWQKVLLYSNVYTAGVDLIRRGYSNYKSLSNYKPLFLATPTDKKVIIIPNQLLEDNYRIGEDQSIIHGAFSRFNNQDDAFKTLMSSNINSTLIIAEKNSIDKRHYGGEKASFSNGLYCEHPKDKNILLPLEKSKEVIEDLILEEIISAYEALGAKRIEINDVLDFESEANAGGIFKGIKFSINGNQKYKKEHVRTEAYGSGVFDPERALRNKKFIYDLSNIMTTINARIHGNQTQKTFKEKIDLSGGINAEVLKMFNASAKINYSRLWQFDVEFYDKNEMEK